MKTLIFLGLMAIAGTAWGKEPNVHHYDMKDIQTCVDDLVGTITCEPSKLGSGDIMPPYGDSGQLTDDKNSWMKTDPEIIQKLDKILRKLDEFEQRFLWANDKQDKIIKMLEEQRLPECQIYYDNDLGINSEDGLFNIPDGKDACIARRK